MLKQMKNKEGFSLYTFGECCLLVMMIIGAVFSSFGLLTAFVFALANHSYLPLIWLIPCGVVAVICYAGLIYVNASEVD